MSELLLITGISSMLCAIGAVILLRALETQNKLSDRLAALQRSANLEQAETSGKRGGVIAIVSSVGMSIAQSGVLSAKTLSELRQTLIVSGFRGNGALGIFVGSKLLSLVILPLVSWLVLERLGVSPLVHNFGTLASAVLGLLGPDIVVKNIRARYLRRLDSGLPDALDMLVICSEAGLGLEPAITRVAAEIHSVHPAVSIELRQTASELRVISDRRLALHNMGSRTGLEGLKRLGSTLIQTTQYGTPVSQALRTLSTEMRTEMLTKFEERAARLPVLLTVPMIVFILPTVFAVVGGPAMLRVFAALRH